MKTIFKATPPGVNHFITTILIMGIVIGYFINIHTYVIVILGIYSLTRIFNDEVSILLYQDRFTVRYSNYFGKFLATDLTYYYSDITAFDYEIERWKTSVGQIMFAFIINYLLPVKVKSPIFKAPSAHIIFNYYDKHKILSKVEIDFLYRGFNYAPALEKIKKKIHAYNSNSI